MKLHYLMSDDQKLSEKHTHYIEALICEIGDEIWAEIFSLSGQTAERG